MAQCSLPCLYTIAALPSGRATMTWPMIFMWFLLRAMIATVSSSGTPGAQTGATMAAATCQFSESCQRKLVYGNARKTSVAGTVAPSTEGTELETIRPRYVRLLQRVKGYIIKLK